MKDLKSVDIQRLPQPKMLLSTILIGFTSKLRYRTETQKEQIKIWDGKFSMDIILETNRLEASS